MIHGKTPRGMRPRDGLNQQRPHRRRGNGQTAAGIDNWLFIYSLWNGTRHLVPSRRTACGLGQEGGGGCRYMCSAPYNFLDALFALYPAAFRYLRVLPAERVCWRGLRPRSRLLALLPVVTAVGDTPRQSPGQWRILCRVQVKARECEQSARFTEG